MRIAGVTAFIGCILCAAAIPFAVVVADLGAARAGEPAMVTLDAWSTSADAARRVLAAHPDIALIVDGPWPGSLIVIAEDAAALAALRGLRPWLLTAAPDWAGCAAPDRRRG